MFIFIESIFKNLGFLDFLAIYFIIFVNLNHLLIRNLEEYFFRMEVRNHKDKKEVIFQEKLFFLLFGFLLSAVISFLLPSMYFIFPSINILTILIGVFILFCLLPLLQRLNYKIIYKIKTKRKNKNKKENIKEKEIIQIDFPEKEIESFLNISLTNINNAISTIWLFTFDLLLYLLIRFIIISNDFSNGRAILIVFIIICNLKLFVHIYYFFNLYSINTLAKNRKLWMFMYNIVVVLSWGVLIVIIIFTSLGTAIKYSDTYSIIVKMDDSYNKLSIQKSVVESQLKKLSTYLESIENNINPTKESISKIHQSLNDLDTKINDLMIQKSKLLLQIDKLEKMTSSEIENNIIYILLSKLLSQSTIWALSIGAFLGFIGSMLANAIFQKKNKKVIK